MKENNIRKRRLKRKARLPLLVIIIISFLLSFVLIFSSFRVKSGKNNLIYSYTSNSDLKYKVFLYENSFIEDQFLDMDESYISDLTKTVQASFIYNYMGSKIVPLNYDYQVDAIISGDYQLKDENTSTKLWNKEYSLVTKKSGSVSDVSQFSINETVDIDYHLFDNIVSEFRQELKLPITADLLVNFKVNVSGVVEGKTFNDSEIITISFPMNQQAFKINKTFDESNSKNLFENTKEQISINILTLICGIILFIITLMIFIRLFSRLFNITKKTQYQIYRNKYLKQYGDIIIEITSPIIANDLKHVQVKNFNEMIDLEEELRIPISFYEDADEEFGQFTIVHNDMIYEYILKDEL